MEIEAALVKERGVLFVVTPVKSHVLSTPSLRRDITTTLSAKFPGAHPILMAQIGTQTNYYGRKDIVQFLSHVQPSRLPWKRWRI